MSELVEHEFRLSVEVVSIPVGCYVSTVSPDASDGLPTDRLPDVLAVLDVLAFEEHLAFRGDDLRGERWHGSEDLCAVEA